MHVSIKLTRTDGPDPPYNHNFMLGSAVYDRLEKASDTAADILHDSHERSAYVVSEIHGVTGTGKEAWFRVGTSSEPVTRLMTEAFRPGEPMRVGPSTFEIRELEVDEPPVRPGRFFTISPVLLREEDSHRSIVHDSDDYHGTLQAAINGQIRNNLDETSNVSLRRVEPQAVRKRTIDGNTYLAQKQRLHLNGSKDHLRFLVNHGIGSSPALGFGMIMLDETQPGPEARNDFPDEGGP
jgi:CRISPR-associated endoribonuclease Cas6